MGRAGRRLEAVQLLLVFWGTDEECRSACPGVSIKSWGIPIADRFFRAAARRGVPSDFHFFLMDFHFLLLVREGCGRALNTGFLGASSCVIPIIFNDSFCFVNIYG